jgi:CRISPR system Cascade subunit CasE
VTLHLVRLPVNLRALAAFAVANRASDDDGGYALHLALRRRFGEAAPQPFRLLADGPAPPHLLGYLADPGGLGEAGGLPALDPLLDDVFGEPQVRAMPGAWREGARFAFEVRVRPVVRYGGRVREARAGREGAFHTGRKRPAQEIDAYLAACERAGPLEDGAPTLPREPVYVDWLTRQLDAAAQATDVELRQFRRARSRRARHASPGGNGDAAPLGRSQVEGPDALMAGTLTIRDPAAFVAVLSRGVGRHVAFGYGMLLLSPPRGG